MDASVIPYLFAATFAIAIVYAIVQWLKVRKAQREHHVSASARAHPEDERKRR